MVEELCVNNPLNIYYRSVNQNLHPEEIHRLVEESAITREHGNLREALEKGKEAGKKEPATHSTFVSLQKRCEIEAELRGHLPLMCRMPG